MIFPDMRSPRVVKPMIGISCCTKQFGVFGMPNHAASDTYVRATDEIVRAVPVLLPANGPTADIETLLDRLDGIILTGSRSNVQPTLYDGPPHAEGTPEDPNRDGITLPLIRAAVARGVPLLAICRGFQELNVALGGSLHQRLQDLPDRMDHSTPMQPSARVRQGKAHAIRVTPGGWLHRLAGTSEIAVNSLHNQGINQLAPGLVVEGTAPDGLIEAVRVAASEAGPAIGYAVGVQWHPEYDWQTDTLSRAIFEQFGTAVRAYGDAARLGGVSIAAD
ncbi:MAG: putative glutamine amidotransferase [Acetobacteraceae bacterium]|jgi:putative glutamine amidotransferase|nr:putative glutamine amidotransferase [Acetobacteraceae bacterium]